MSKTRRAAGDSRHRSAPMPTSWAPWPGNSQPTAGAEGWGRKRSWLFATESGALDLYGLSTLVLATDGTGVVRAAHGPALRAAREAGQLEGQMAAALALS